MSSYYGLFSYPHGGRASAFLLLTMIAGTVCTCFSVSTCRFVTLEFQSQYGDFGEHFAANDPTSEYLTTYQVGVGLFTWLRPFDTLEYDKGSCAGYNELQRDEIVQGTFEKLRIVAIIAVIVSICLFLFSLTISCLSLTQFQRYIMIAATMMLAVATGSTFLVSQSSICTEVGVNPSCNMDQGGLAAIGGIVSWVLNSLILTFCIRPVHESKLTPREKSQRKRAMHKKQLDLLNQLEEIESDRRLTAAIAAWKRKVAPTKQGTRSDQSRGHSASEQQRQQSRALPSSDPRPRTGTDNIPCIRIIEKEAAPNTASRETLLKINPVTQAQRGVDFPPTTTRVLSPVPTRIPDVLPKNKNQLAPRTAPAGSRKHKQHESPKVSPLRHTAAGSQWRTSGLMDIYDVAALPSTEQDEIEAVYIRRAHPVKKRRLQSQSRSPQAENTEAMTKQNKSAEKPRSPPGGYHGELAVLVSPGEKDSGRTVMPPSLPLFQTSPRSVQRVMETYSKTQYPSTEVSTVLTDQAVNENVEVAIDDTLDAINSILDDGTGCGDGASFSIHPNYRVEV